MRESLPSHIAYYTFNGDLMTFNSRKPCPGKAYLEPKAVLIRVYNATLARYGGFSGEIIALGDHVDSFSVNDFVFGGGVNCVQQYIVVKANCIALKPKELGFADAARLYSATVLYEGIKHLEQDMRVLILGDMTGFGVQLARERGCIITSSEDFDCGEETIIDEDNYLKWLEEHTNQFDAVVDATGDLELYDYCELFTSPLSEYISIDPESTFHTAKSLYLPKLLGGVSRRLSIARAPTAEACARLLHNLAKRLLNDELHILNQRIVAYENINTIMPSQRYVTAVNIIKQCDIDAVASQPRETRAKGKERSKSAFKHRRTTSSSSFDGSALTTSSIPSANPYSPRQPSRLAQSISASLTDDRHDGRQALPPQRQSMRAHNHSRPLHKNPLSLSEEDEEGTITETRDESLSEIDSSRKSRESSEYAQTETSEGTELSSMPNRNYTTKPTVELRAHSPFVDQKSTDIDVGDHHEPDDCNDGTQEQIDALQQQVALLTKKQKDRKAAVMSARGLGLFDLEQDHQRVEL